MSIADNLREVRRKIDEALAEAGRTDNVTLVAVTKYSGVPEVLEAIRAGQTVFAENRVQMLLDKWRRLDELRDAGVQLPELHWHMIGRLQTNKVKYIVGKVELIHSCDSLRLAEEISRQSVKAGVVSRVLIEVNVSGEASKSGVTPEETEEFVRQCAALPGLTVCGLMTMAPEGAPGSELTQIFSHLNKLFVDIGAKSIYNCPMTTLSMGMSADFVEAVKCGSNMVRVGHRIFS
ncbi:MAG: YggS family pyridoxal phosphate-dependent enzyme [Clostridia bacterium]|nr:YggS family pyridoxal phosphate-dependent enzyme [Clostridia bacterium]